MYLNLQKLYLICYQYSWWKSNIKDHNNNTQIIADCCTIVSAESKR